jgi:hypothetical protein
MLERHLRYCPEGSEPGHFHILIDHIPWVYRREIMFALLEQKKLPSHTVTHCAHWLLTDQNPPSSFSDSNVKLMCRLIKSDRIDVMDPRYKEGLLHMGRNRFPASIGRCIEERLSERRTAEKAGAAGAGLSDLARGATVSLAQLVEASAKMEREMARLQEEMARLREENARLRAATGEVGDVHPVTVSLGWAVRDASGKGAEADQAH